MTIEEFIRDLSHRGEPLSERQLAAFEKEIGYALPADYRSFLKQSNGGFVGGRLWFDENTGVHHVYGIRDDKGHFDLRLHIQSYLHGSRAVLPPGAIPIADDPFGNGICLILAGKHEGEVWFWDHEGGCRGSASLESASDMSFVAQSFTAFVARLAPLPDEM